MVSRHAQHMKQVDLRCRTGEKHPNIQSLRRNAFKNLEKLESRYDEVSLRTCLESDLTLCAAVHLLGDT